MKDMPASNEVHEAIEEGVTAIFQAGPVRVDHRQEGQRHRRRVHPDGPRRARRVGPAPPGAGPGHRVHDPLRPRPAGHRPGPGPDLDRSRVGRHRGDQAAPPEGRLGHLRDRPAGRVRHRRRPDRRGHRRRGDRRGPALGLRRRCLPAGHGPGRDPDPPDAGRAAARVPLDRAVHQRGQAAALPDDRARRRGAEPQLHRVRAAVHARGRGRRNRPAACSAPARRSASATCGGSGSSTGRRSRRSSRSTTRAPAIGA